MKPTLDKLLNQEVLNQREAYTLLCSIGSGNVSAAQMAAFMSVYRLREITLDELRGFRSALLELALPVRIDSHHAIDLCGTGGDGKNTFNISTLASFVVAACGGRVIKHGNYGVSSVSGSSTVLEKLGYRFTTDSDLLNRTLDESGVCFLHAPLFHPALKHVAEVRMNLGVRTFFNSLGPLVNLAKPSHRLTGVFSNELLRKYQYLLQETDERYTLVHSDDGHDEIALTSFVTVVTNATRKVYAPMELGFNKYADADLFGGTSADEAANIFLNILNGNGTSAQNDVVCVNAAFALLTLGIVSEIEEGVALASESIYTGNALKRLRIFLAASGKQKVS